MHIINNICNFYEYDEFYKIKKELVEYAKEYNISISEIEYGEEYPEEVEW